MIRRFFLIITIFLVACETSDEIRTFPEPQSYGEDTETSAQYRIKAVTFCKVPVIKKKKQIYTKAQLEVMATETITEAEAKAKAEQALFNIRTKQEREKRKQRISEWVAYGSFAICAFAIVMGGITKGFATWGIIAGIFFAMGAVSLVMPELSDWLKWAIIGGAALVIVKTLSHTKNFSCRNLITKHEQKGSNQ